MSGLPREILKWLQSLDLSYSIKNVRRCECAHIFSDRVHETESVNSHFWRAPSLNPDSLIIPLARATSDFANGFLAAEIFSRYFKGEIAMHSFDNGAATVKKTDNWAQLMKFFTRMGFPITQTMCDDVMNARPDAASALISVSYTILTQKAAPTRPAAELVDASPAFARPTASQLVRDTMHALGAKVPVDLKEKSSKAQTVVDQHNQQNRQEKMNDPSRFQAKRNTTKLARVPARSIGSSESDGPQIQFVKEVSVKRIDDNVAQLRASKAAAAASSSARGFGGTASDFPVQQANAGGGVGGGAAKANADAGAAAHAAAGNSKPVLSLLSAGVLIALDGAPQLQVCALRGVGAA